MLPSPTARRALATLVLALAAVTSTACSSTEQSQRRTAMSTYREAVLALREGDSDRALDLAARSAKEAPGFVDPHLFMGGVQERLGDLDRARAHYRHALALDPTFTAIGVRIGLTFVSEERFDEAEEWFAKAMESDPGSFQAAFNLGTLCRQTGRPDEAAEWYRLAASLEPRDMDALVHLSRLRLEAGDAEGAREAALQALERIPSELPEGEPEPPVIQAARDARDAAQRALGL